MQLKTSFLIALTLSVLSLGSWELYWRSQGKTPNLDDNKELWAVQRAQATRATSNDVLLLGSSRVLFDIQLNEWEQATGIRPIQLASAGASPLPIFHDIVQNTPFAGTILVGVTPGLFFSTTYPEAGPWKRAQTRVDYHHEQTYAQKINHQLSLPLQENLVFISTSEEGWSDDIGLKSLLGRINLENRTGENPMPPFYFFGDITRDRNVQMTSRTVEDTVFANSIIKVWKFFGGTAPPPDKESTTAYFLKDAEQFIARGGNVILVRCPSSGGLRVGESMGLPREQFWDELVSKIEAKSYHFEDYDQLKGFYCPEWSHLSGSDAQTFTTELIKIMQKDGALTNAKTN